MSHEDPTLKVRFKLGGSGSYLGRDCNAVARGIAEAVDVGPFVGLEVIDAKWGRTPSEWRSTGGGWGRQKLTDYERGYLAGLDAVEGGAPAGLLSIIERLTGGAS